MRIKEVYQYFKLPLNLQEHMLRVAGIICLVEKHWVGEKVDWDTVKKMALLHDLGNIIKFDLEKRPELLGPMAVDLDYWKKVREETIQQYGADDEVATSKMLTEIGVDEKLIQIIRDKWFGNSVGVKNSTDWHLKLLYYADLRTLPFGVGTLEERLADVRVRMPKYTSRPDFEELVLACREIEQQIQKNLAVPVAKITAETAKYDESMLMELVVKV